MRACVPTGMFVSFPLLLLPHRLRSQARAAIHLLSQAAASEMEMTTHAFQHSPQLHYEEYIIPHVFGGRSSASLKAPLVSEEDQLSWP